MNSQECAQVRELLATLVDSSMRAFESSDRSGEPTEGIRETPGEAPGEIPDDVLDHLAVCDSCRDARHEATLAVDAVALSGFDYVHPPDMTERVLSKLDEHTIGSCDSEAGVSADRNSTDETDEPLHTIRSTRDPARSTPTNNSRVRQRDSAIPEQRRRSLFAYGAAAVVLLAVGGVLLWQTRDRGPDSDDSVSAVTKTRGTPGPWRDPALLEWKRGGRFRTAGVPDSRQRNSHSEDRIYSDDTPVWATQAVCVPHGARDR